MHYHLGCLKPPLTKMPKKSRIYGWVCAECGLQSDEEINIVSSRFQNVILLNHHKPYFLTSYRTPVPLAIESGGKQLLGLDMQLCWISTRLSYWSRRHLRRERRPLQNRKMKRSIKRRKIRVKDILIFHFMFNFYKIP